ncbi:hypothetical protein [Microbulbifer thermotolerans]|uniref:Uncharacterized protein n=1 Tax=Microbulbifer thermotolerans TaxID=252514 RepID=A0AB35HXA4_MICTH|nr:hypothetical protein [Microbulbifer thermotolerans]MCX2782557.1 hypothetical protein [Microbulbifer thermotolerans]MCX2801397.1 hypothetical protein [Microbulbifer thermotolerans]MCX2841959.1 hypothetical protein [Microbulbifer thermotolerans]WKT59208.1 hypothetical protein Q2E61_09755 [Microbulbifer thermotolerans]
MQGNLETVPADGYRLNFGGRLAVALRALATTEESNALWRE